MSIHDTNIKKSIELNIIGTSNVVIACSMFKLKLIYFSTGYVYPGLKGNYKEHDAVNPLINMLGLNLEGSLVLNFMITH